jgi:hypothetical protein
VSDVYAPVSSPLVNRPASAFVVDAVAALLRDDVGGARMCLIQGAARVGLPAIAHRLDVAGRALAVDAGLLEDDDRDAEPPIVLLPGLDTSAWAAGHEDDVAAVLTRWSGGADDDLPVDRIWPSLAVVAWLVDRAGYPPEVVV